MKIQGCVFHFPRTEDRKGFTTFHGCNYSLGRDSGGSGRKRPPRLPAASIGQQEMAGLPDVSDFFNGRLTPQTSTAVPALRVWSGHCTAAPDTPSTKASGRNMTTRSGPNKQIHHLEFFETALVPLVILLSTRQGPARRPGWGRHPYDLSSVVDGRSPKGIPGRQELVNRSVRLRPSTIGSHCGYCHNRALNFGCPAKKNARWARWDRTTFSTPQSFGYSGSYSSPPMNKYRYTMPALLIPRSRRCVRSLLEVA